MVNKNAWRWSLHPADPDYDPPPSAEEMDEDPAPELDDVYGDDPRCDGPWNYVPPGER